VPFPPSPFSFPFPLTYAAEDEPILASEMLPMGCARPLFLFPFFPSLRLASTKTIQDGSKSATVSIAAIACASVRPPPLPFLRSSPPLFSLLSPQSRIGECPKFIPGSRKCSRPPPLPFFPLGKETNVLNGGNSTRLRHLFLFFFPSSFSLFT